jgi:hypothetical protein
MIYGQPLLLPSPAGIDPIGGALEYLSDLGISSLLPKARLGVHVHNPYHNLNHELLVVYHAMTAYWRTHGGFSHDRFDEALELAIAALFHDHDHSGGKTQDDTNIERALAFVCTLPMLQSPNEKQISRKLDTVCGMIRKTMFMNGAFPIEPTSFRQQCLRDADLCSIYTTQGQLLLMELPREMGKPAVYRMGKGERAQFLTKNKVFLQSCQMYTDYGKLMQEFHLDRACEEFEDLVERAVSDNYVPGHTKWLAQ